MRRRVVNADVRIVLIAPAVYALWRWVDWSRGWGAIEALGFLAEKWAPQHRFAGRAERISPIGSFRRSLSYGRAGVESASLHDERSLPNDGARAMPDNSRRQFLTSLGIAAITPELARAMIEASSAAPSSSSSPAARGVRVRTITAGVAMPHSLDRDAVARALELLARAKTRFETEGYEVQTTRITMPPVIAALDDTARRTALPHIAEIDTMVAANGAVCALGPVLIADRAEDALAPWASDVVKATKSTSFSVMVASLAGGVHAHAARVAADVMHAVAGAVPDGKGSFRFAAAANVPAGTPFFPVGWHEGSSSIAIGMESADLVRAAFAEATDVDDGRRRLTERMTTELRAVERIAAAIAAEEKVRYGGIDPSPAPMGDVSIGGALEALSHVPFGDAGTLRACAVVTEVLKSIPVLQCGYAGLMLPVLEDKVLARRAVEGRYGLRDLLLFSSVCGTGLDVVPVPGDTNIDTLTNIILDVAAQSVKLKKPLSVRLYLAPGAKPGDAMHVNDPLLTDSVVFRA